MVKILLSSVIFSATLFAGTGSFVVSGNTVSCDRSTLYLRLSGARLSTKLLHRSVKIRLSSARSCYERAADLLAGPSRQSFSYRANMIVSGRDEYVYETRCSRSPHFGRVCRKVRVLKRRAQKIETLRVDVFGMTLTSTASINSSSRPKPLPTRPYPRPRRRLK